jgi:hypothetical protein
VANLNKVFANEENIKKMVVPSGKINSVNSLQERME